MTAGNVERARRWFAAMGEGPEAALAILADHWDADADYYPVRKFPEARPCHGREEIAGFVGPFLEAWSRSEWDIRDVIAVGDQSVLTALHLKAEGRMSGMRLEGEMYSCSWLRHGRFFRVEDHLTLKGAMRALGLDEETTLEDLKTG